MLRPSHSSGVGIRIRLRHVAAAVIAGCATFSSLGIVSSASAQPLDEFYRMQAVANDEAGLSAAEQEEANVRARRRILGQIAAHNGSIILGFVPSLWISVPAEIVGVAADTSLKFTRAVLRAPADLALLPNATDPLYAADGACLFEFELPQASAKFGNFLGAWPRVQYDSGDVDRIRRNRPIPADRFGILGSPEIYHANTDVNLYVSIPGARNFVEASPGTQQVLIGPGVHDVIWRADTLYSLIWDTAFPAALIPVFAAMEAKFAKYFDDLAAPSKKLRGEALELTSVKSNLDELAALIDTLNRRINFIQRLDRAVDLGFGLEPITTEAIINRIANGRPSVSRRRIQQLTVYDTLPPTIEILKPSLTFEATDIGGTRTSRYLDEFEGSTSAFDACGRPVVVFHDAPEVLPLGDNVVTWTVRDPGPVRPGVDHDGDGTPDDDPYNSRTVTQIVTVEDTQAPILVPPPGLVIESATDIDLATQPLGQPLVVDLADLHPDVTSSTPNASGLVDPDTRTLVTWTATDDSGNASMRDQLVTVKTPGTNTAPVVGDVFENTLTSRSIDIVLEGVDADLLPYTHEPLGPGIADPLQFKIEQLPQNGEFIAPLYPFFIDDYRTDEVGGIIDYIGGDAALMASYVQAVNTNSLANWMNTEFCSNAIEAPVDFVFEPQFVQVTDDGEQYFFDQYLVCDPNGTNDPEWATYPRISGWSADRVFLGAARIDDGGGGISGNDAVFRIGADDFLYFIDNTTGGESGVLSIQRCSAILTDTTNNPPYCQSQSYFGPLDSGRTSSNIDPVNAYIDSDRGLVYVKTGTNTARVDVFALDDERFLGTLVDDSVDPPVPEFLNACGSFSATQFDDSMEVDAAGNLYVIDGRCDRIHRFGTSSLDDEGQFVRGGYVGWLGRCNGSNNLACDVPNERTKGYSCTTASACTIPDDPMTIGLDTGGSEIGQFQNPAFLAMDPNDVLYVADYSNQRIQRFGPDGTFAGEAKSTGNGINAESEGGFVLGNMGPPKHVTVNSRNFFVVDQSENFVHIFDTSPFKDVTDYSATVAYVSDFAFHSATDTFMYSVNDGLVDSNVGTVSVFVARNYRQPLPRPQAVPAREDRSSVIVLSGTDPDGILDRDFNGLDSLTFSITREPEHGTLVAGGDPGDGVTLDPGTAVYTYTPDRDYYGPDSLAFTVRDAFTDQTNDGGTQIPEPYGEAEPAEVGITVAPVNDIPIVRIDPPERVAAGFELMLQATVFDDGAESYDATVSWGDGTVDRDGEALVDNSGTPADPTDDVSYMTGIVYSTEALRTIGQTRVNAMHRFTGTGPRAVSLCLRDAGLLESCDTIDVNVESLVSLGSEVKLSDSEIPDGIPFSASIEIENSEPAAGVIGLEAQDVRLAMEIPSELLALGVAASQGVCAIDAGVLECTLGAMPNGAIATIDLNLRGKGTLIYDTDALLLAEVTTATPSLGDYGLGAVSVALTAVPNDRDADGLPNIYEAYYGVSEPDADDDGDGLDNAAELDAGTSPVDADTDGDGVSDSAEANTYGTDPLEADSDADGLTDFDEITVHGTDPLAEDSDADGLPDQWELDNGFDALVADGDGDADLDGLSDAEEYAQGTDHLTPDTDGDGLDDGAEVAVHGTDPAAADTDGDGLDDGAELVAGTDALKPDSDDDGLDDGPEALTFLTDPTRADTDRDGLPDGWEVRNGRVPLVADYAVAAGGLSSCALTDVGVECWGRNDVGQAPAVVAGLNDPEVLTVGYVHACAIDRSVAGVPSVVCWGDNAFGQRNVPALVAPFAIAAGGYHTCALDRTTPTTTALVCWGRDNFGQVTNAPTTLENPVELASAISGNTSCVLDDTAAGPELVCWGRDDSGEVTSAPTGLTSLAGPLAMGSEHGCLVDGGELRCWGLNVEAQAPPGPTPTTAASLALGGFHSCALDTLGRDEYGVACWGRDVDGQASVPAALVDPIGIAAGSHHTCALDGGAAKCWGAATTPGFQLGQAPALRALDIDPDADTLSTADELAAGTDPLDPDSDRDGLPDAVEPGLGTDPLDGDSDDDGLLDGAEVNLYLSNALDADTDGDGLPDAWEVDHGSQIAVADADADVDADGLAAGVEHARETDPNVADSDGDDLDDGAELARFRYESTGQALGAAISEAVELGDLDGDGDLDALVANRGSAHALWLNDGSGTFGLSEDNAFNTETATDVELFDVDFDGDFDAYLAHSDAGVPSSLWRNDGAGHLTESATPGLPPASSEGVEYGRVALGPDASAMGVFVANWGANQVGNFEPPDSVLLSGIVSDSLAGNSEDVALGDLDGDGLDDAFVVNRSQPNQLFRNLGGFLDPVFDEDGQFGGNDLSIAVDLGDVDADGDLDAFEVIFGAPDKVWLNNGFANFTDSGQLIGSDGGNDVSLFDIDGDGLPEALVANTGPNKLWLNDGTGAFTDSGQVFGNATTFGLAVGDLDGDLDPDAYFANDGANEIWLLNQLEPGEVDTDGDGAFDGWEIANGFDPLDDADGALDPDGDGLTNAEEFDADSDPLVADSDFDGMPDAFEIANGLNPMLDDAALDRDADGLANLDEYLSGADPQADDVAPDLTVPADVTADSTGALTAVAIGQATAIDARDGPVAASVDDPGPYIPGGHLLTWSASDFSGNLAEDDQNVGVTPQVSFVVDQTVDEGDTALVGLMLNGAAITYPVVVDYTVAGAATNPEDHNAAAGSISIASGTAGAIAIDIVGDFVFEGPETFTLTLTGATNAVPGAQAAHTITITQANVKPAADIVAMQNGRRVTTAYADQGEITVMAEIVDPNTGDSHTLDWSASDPGVFDPASFTAASYTLDPAAIADGTYDLVLDLADDGVPIATNRVSSRLRLARTTPVLSFDEDSDGDGVNDGDEGATDGDGDGIPDYLDADDSGSVLVYSGDGMVLETQPGLRLRLGAAAFGAGSQAELPEAAIGEETDYGYPNGVADFEITGVAPGGSARVVLPLRHPLPANAVYRKHIAGAWQDFVVDAANAIASAPGGQGACPAPGSGLYVAGLNPGDACVELLIQDGGPNDADQTANGTIVDPSGVAVPVGVSLAVIAAADRTVGGTSAANVVMTLRLTSDSGDVELRSLTLAASGSGDDRTIERVDVVVDANGNSAVDTNDPSVGTGTFTANDGDLTITLTSPLPIPAGQTDLLVTYDF
jgi:hypothetical protein